MLPSDAAIAEIAQDAVKVGLWRMRLADLGWFMNASMKPIARSANREDDCSGAFWEGRFHSLPLLNQLALIASLALIDLNPIRTKIAVRPETSLYTSGYRRIRA